MIGDYLPCERCPFEYVACLPSSCIYFKGFLFDKIPTPIKDLEPSKDVSDSLDDFIDS
jgi:hypothetical protein